MNDYINNAHFFKRARNIRNELLRNELLNKTDKYILSDYPITLEKQMIIKTCRNRQEFRDFINNDEIKILAGENVGFPIQPNFIDLCIIY